MEKEMESQSQRCRGENGEDVGVQPLTFTGTGPRAPMADGPDLPWKWQISAKLG